MLRETPIHKVWPFTKYLCFCCVNQRKRSFRWALKRSIRQKLEIPSTKADKIIEEDPYLLLGYGINSYFTTMLQLLLLMVAISCLAVPLMIYFSTFHGTNGEVGHIFSQFTLGNLGGSSTFCTQARIGSHQAQTSVILQCTTGSLDIEATAHSTGLPV